MISIILYGRNDQHGYQYHKRLALSLNNLAHLLSHVNDEIIFVDYNTPNDLPTLIESVQDILTEKAKLIIRILRVRPQVHQNYKHRTSRKVLEALARNTAIRRSNPVNPWILSTNPDMIFLPREHSTLSDIVAPLEKGFYTLPRFEIPEYLWDMSLDRLHPGKNIKFLQDHSVELHLHMSVHEKPFIGYENVGDFQLMNRNDIFHIGGFDENMQLGWHVDANLSKRMFCLHHEIKNLSGRLYGFHCNHIRDTNNDMHGKFHLENDWKKFVTEVTTPYTTSLKNWGLKEQTIEEIKLSQNKYFEVLLNLQKMMPAKSYEKKLNPTNFNLSTYDTFHTFPYLADHLATIPSHTKIVYLGFNDTLKKQLTSLLYYLHGTTFTCNDIINADIYIFDFGFDTDDKRDSITRKKLQKQVMKYFSAIIVLQKKHKKQNKLIGIHTSYTYFRYLFKMKVNMSDSGYNTNICYGYAELKKPALKRAHLFSRCKLWLQYCYVRYFFNGNDKIHEKILGSRLVRYFIKT